jgi:excisionase family DNA binding protein
MSEERCLTIEEFADLHRIGRTTTYAEIKAGRLRVRKVGKRRIITPEDAKEWRDRLPIKQTSLRNSTQQDARHP